MTTAIKPTPERRQHDQIIRHHDTGEAGRVARRVQPPIEVLYKRHTIDQRQHDAAVRWLDDYEVALQGARDMDGELPPGVNAGSVEGHSARRIAAMTRVRQGYQAMGKQCAPVVDAVVVGRCSLSVLARESGEARDYIRGLLDVGLSALADYYRL